MPEQALENLKDIQLPGAVSFFPMAYGWWMLLLLLLVAAAVAFYYYRQYRSRQAEREALAHLDQLYLNFLGRRNASEFCAGLSILLRRYALCHFPRQQVAGLVGERWLLFLDESGGQGQFSRGPGRVLIEAPYRKNAIDVNVEALLRLCKHWFRQVKR